MADRPQFSLRMLLFIMVTVCITAATVADLPKNPRLGRHIQTATSAALCVVLPAIFTAGAIRSQGYTQSFWIGGLSPALGPLMMASVILFKTDNAILSDKAMYFWWLLSQRRYLFTTVWAIIPCASALSLFAHWLLTFGQTQTRETRISISRFMVGMVLLGLLVACAATAMFVTPTEAAPWPEAQGVLHLAMTFSLASLLTIGTVQGGRACRAFSAGAAVPAFVEMEHVCEIAYGDDSLADSLGLLSVYGQSSGALWASSFACGLAFLVVYWLLHRGRSMSARE